MPCLGENKKSVLAEVFINVDKGILWQIEISPTSIFDSFCFVNKNEEAFDFPRRFRWISEAFLRLRGGEKVSESYFSYSSIRDLGWA